MMKDFHPDGKAVYSRQKRRSSGGWAWTLRHPGNKAAMVVKGEGAFGGRGKEW